MCTGDQEVVAYTSFLTKFRIINSKVRVALCTCTYKSLLDYILTQNIFSHNDPISLFRPFRLNLHSSLFPQTQKIHDTSSRNKGFFHT